MQTPTTIYKPDDITVVSTYINSRNQLYLIYIAKAETNFYCPGVTLRQVNADEAEVTFARAPIRDSASVKVDYSSDLLTKWLAAEKHQEAENFKIDPAYAMRPNEIVVIPFTGKKLFSTDGSKRVLIYSKQ